MSKRSCTGGSVHVACLEEEISRSLHAAMLSHSHNCMLAVNASLVEMCPVFNEQLPA